MIRKKITLTVEERVDALIKHNGKLKVSGGSPGGPGHTVAEMEDFHEEKNMRDSYITVPRRFVKITRSGNF